jgi:Fe2+ transport system protein FeoA/Mn-dependent DtxR family transcriptional regulator
MPNLYDYFWPSLAVLLAVLWLWTLWRHRKPSALPPSAERGSSGLIEAEDVLKSAYTLQDTEETWTVENLARSMRLPESLVRRATDVLLDSGWAQRFDPGDMRLTAEGEARAQDLIRAHRLWERYLVDEEGLSLEAVHAEAHRREHDTTAEELGKLDAALKHPAWDPHGHVIPGSGDRVPSPIGRPLSEEGRPGRRLRIVSLDDEPASLLAQLVALGLKPGVDVQVLACEQGVLRLKVDGDSVPLASAAARHVCVMAAPTLPVKLGGLPAGSQAQVMEITGEGKHQRRLLDMGFVPGAEVDVIRKAPLGDPVEYGIKGTAVALRRDEADTILVEEL